MPKIIIHAPEVAVDADARQAIARVLIPISFPQTLTAARLWVARVAIAEATPA